MSKQKKASVLVCVTGRRDCDRLILVGKKLSKLHNVPLQVLCVQPMNHGFCAKSDEIEHLYQVTKDAGAERTIFFHDEAALITAGFVKQVGAKHIVTGMPDGRANGFVEMIHRLIPMVPISMVSEEGQIYNMYPSIAFARAQVSAMG